MEEGLTSVRPWKRRVNQFVSLHVKHFPCLRSVFYQVAKNTCWRRSRYQTLGQDEAGDGSEDYDDRQHVNRKLGQALVSLSMLLMMGITVMLLFQSEDVAAAAEADASLLDFHTLLESDKDEFRHDAPLVLYFGALELLICGACAHTAAVMFGRRRHALKHPADSVGREQKGYIKVQLEKERGSEDSQFHGLGFRVSSDGLECLIVETVRYNSLLYKWNKNALTATPEALVKQAFREYDDDDSGAAPAQSASDDAAPAEGAADPDGEGPPPQVKARAAVVAVNDVAADVGMMQLQLLKPTVTLWVRPEVGPILEHASQFDENVFAAGAAEPPGGVAEPGVQLPGGAPGATSYGAPSEPAAAGDVAAGTSASPAPAEGGPGEAERCRNPRCACLRLEDEEPQILMRWTVCSLLVGWVTLVPVLLMHPHEERPRQKLFRKHLLRPCLVALPLWILLWVLDCAQLLLAVQLVHPFYYLGTCHIAIPAVLFWFIMQMQAADEKLVLDQRRNREAEAGSALPIAVEDPVPTILKELVTTNPVGLVLIGACAAGPIVLITKLTPLVTERGRLAQQYIYTVFGPLVFLQLMFLALLWQLNFTALPKIYLALLGMLFSMPFLVLWCTCFVCTSRYSRQDMALVRKQRLARAQEAKERIELLVAEAGGGRQHQEASSSSTEAAAQEHELLVDCTETLHTEWELIYTA